MRKLNFLKNLSVRSKLILFSLLILIPAFSVSGYLETKMTEELIKQEAVEKAKSDIQTTYQVIDSKYPGAWRVQDGSLFKGDMLLSGNFTIVDDIGKMTNGDTATLFLNDTRVSTNVKKEDGSRAVGTKASAIVIETVLKKGEIYLGEANVVGKTYQSAYMPLKDVNGKIIGMWYVGAPQERVDAAVKMSAREVAATAMITILLAILINTLFTIPLTRQIRELLAAFSKTEKGDFTVRVPVRGRDEFGQLAESMNRMNEQLQGLIGQVKQSAATVAETVNQVGENVKESVAASQEVAQNMQQVAAGADAQTASVEQISAIVEETSAGLQEMAASTQKVADLSNQVIEQANQGGTIIRDSMQQMNQITNTVDGVGNVIGVLKEHANRITDIIELITSIANQTNLLALNAAIEAARAGEHGRGFSVVADEVRKLAEETSHSAQEIRDMIQQVIEQTDSAVNAVAESKSAVETGQELSKQAATSFQRIQQSVHEVSENVQSVSAAIEQIAAGSQEMVRSMERITEVVETNSERSQAVAAVTEQQTAGMDEVAKAADYLREISKELEKAVASLKI